MVMLLWLTGGVGFSRVHPLLITQLVLCFFSIISSPAPGAASRAHDHGRTGQCEQE